MQKLDVNFGFKENAYVLVAWSSGIVSAWGVMGLEIESGQGIGW
jgi:hypothetical protein